MKLSLRVLSYGMASLAKAARRSLQSMKFMMTCNRAIAIYVQIQIYLLICGLSYILRLAFFIVDTIFFCMAHSYCY